MKRIIYLCLLLALLLPVLVVPVSATTVSDVTVYAVGDDYNNFQGFERYVAKILDEIIENWGLLQQWLSLIADNLVNAVSKSLVSIYKTLNDICDWIADWVVYLLTEIEGSLILVNDNLGVINDNVISWFDAMNGNMISWFKAVIDNISNFIDYMVGYWSSFLNKFDSFRTLFTEKLDALLKGDTDAAEDQGDRLDNWIDDAFESNEYNHDAQEVRPDAGKISTTIKFPLKTNAVFLSCLSTILGANVFLPVVGMVLTLCLCSYILYGKKG